PPYGAALMVTKRGEAYQDRFPKTIGAYKKQIKTVAKHFAGLDVSELERLGTALYAIRELPDSSDEDRARWLVEVKPHIEFDSAVDAVTCVEGFLREDGLKAAAKS